MPLKPPVDMNSRESASAVDADDHLKAQRAADAATADIEKWEKESFAQGGRQQLQRDESYGYKETRQK